MTASRRAKTLDRDGISANRGGPRIQTDGKRRTKRKIPRSLGRYPFLTISERYLSSCGLSEYTVVERRRKLKHINSELQALRAEGKADTTNPQKVGEREIEAFVNGLIARGLRGKSFEHEVTALGAVLDYVGNAALRTYKKRHANLFRRYTMTVRLPPLTKEDYNRVLAGSRGIDKNDWSAVRSYAVVMLALASGARHKELREGRIDDLRLDEGNEHYHIAHPKGEYIYAEPRDPPLRPECVPLLRRYMRLREDKDLEHPGNDFLFPALRNSSTGRLSSNSITRMVRWVGRHAGVGGLDIHICRRTYGQMLLDEGASIEAVSVLLGHKTTAMTERAYCRRRQDQAVRMAREAWRTMQAP